AAGAVDRSSATTLAGDHPLVAPALLAPAAHSRRRAADRRRPAQHPPVLRVVDAAARPGAARRGRAVAAPRPRSPPRLDRAAPAAMAARGGAVIHRMGFTPVLVPPFIAERKP